MQKDLKEGIVSELKPTREVMKNLSKAVTFSQFPSIAACDDDGEEEEDVFIGDIAEQYLRKFAAVLVQIRQLDCGKWMVSFTLVRRKQK